MMMKVMPTAATSGGPDRPRKSNMPNARFSLIGAERWRQSDFGGVPDQRWPLASQKSRAKEKRIIIWQVRDLEAAAPHREQSINHASAPTIVS